MHLDSTAAVGYDRNMIVLLAQRQDLSCMYLAHDELQSVMIIIVIRPARLCTV